MATVNLMELPDLNDFCQECGSKAHIGLCSADKVTDAHLQKGKQLKLSDAATTKLVNWAIRNRNNQQYHEFQATGSELTPADQHTASRINLILMKTEPTEKDMGKLSKIKEDELWLFIKDNELHYLIRRAGLVKHKPILPGSKDNQLSQERIDAIKNSIQHKHHVNEVDRLEIINILKRRNHIQLRWNEMNLPQKIWAGFGYTLSGIIAFSSGISTAAAFIGLNLVTGGLPTYLIAAFILITGTAMNWYIFSKYVPSVLVDLFARGKPTPSLDELKAQNEELHLTKTQKFRRTVRWGISKVFGSFMQGITAKDDGEPLTTSEKVKMALGSGFALSVGLTFGALAYGSTMLLTNTFAFLGVISAGFPPIAAALAGVTLICMTAMMLRDIATLAKTTDIIGDVRNFFKDMFDTSPELARNKNSDGTAKKPGWIRFRQGLQLFLTLIALPLAGIGLYMTMNACAPNMKEFLVTKIPQMSEKIAAHLTNFIALFAATAGQVPFAFQTAVNMVAGFFSAKPKPQKYLSSIPGLRNEVSKLSDYDKRELRNEIQESFEYMNKYEARIEKANAAIRNVSLLQLAVPLIIIPAALALVADFAVKVGNYLSLRWLFARDSQPTHYFSKVMNFLPRLAAERSSGLKLDGHLNVVSAEVKAEGSKAIQLLSKLRIHGGINASNYLPLLGQLDKYLTKKIDAREAAIRKSEIARLEAAYWPIQAAALEKQALEAPLSERQSLLHLAKMLRLNADLQAKRFKMAEIIKPEFAPKPASPAALYDLTLSAQSFNGKVYNLIRTLIFWILPLSNATGNALISMKGAGTPGSPQSVLAGLGGFENSITAGLTSRPVATSPGGMPIMADAPLQVPVKDEPAIEQLTPPSPTYAPLAHELDYVTAGPRDLKSDSDSEYDRDFEVLPSLALAQNRARNSSSGIEMRRRMVPPATRTRTPTPAEVLLGAPPPSSAADIRRSLMAASSLPSPASSTESVSPDLSPKHPQTSGWDSPLRSPSSLSTSQSMPWNLRMNVTGAAGSVSLGRSALPVYNADPVSPGRNGILAQSSSGSPNSNRALKTLALKK